MAKYNFELKKKIVLEHLSLGVGSKALAKKYNVKSARQIRQWIHNYNEFGEEGLKRSRQKNNYYFEFKIHMVESYLSNEVSYEVDSKRHMTMHKLYLDPFMDMCNGEILSFGIDKHPSAENVLVALEKAIKITSDCPYRRTFHSDQG